MRVTAYLRWLSNNETRAVIDRAYSLWFPTVGALYERPSSARSANGVVLAMPA